MTQIEDVRALLTTEQNELADDDMIRTAISYLPLTATLGARMAARIVQSALKIEAARG